MLLEDLEMQAGATLSAEGCAMAVERIINEHGGYEALFQVVQDKIKMDLAVILANQECEGPWEPGIYQEEIKYLQSLLRKIF